MDRVVVRMLRCAVVFVLCFLIPCVGVAQNFDHAVITHEGTQGFFFSEDVGTRILLDLEAYQVQSAHVRLLDTKIELQDTKILLLAQSVELADKIAAKYKLNYELEHKLRLADAEAYEEKLARKNSFWKSPGLWFGIGFVIAGSLAVGLSFSLQETRSN